MTTRILKYCIPLLTGIAAIGACSKSPEDNIPAGMPGTGFTVTLHAEGIGSRTAADDSAIGEVYGYRFADGVLAEILHGENNGGGRYTFHPSALDGEIRFVANDLDGIFGQTEPGACSLEEFTSAEAARESLAGEYLLMTGRIELDGTLPVSAAVRMKRSVARIDLTSPDSGVEVLGITLRGIADRGYVFGQESAATPPPAGSSEFARDYGDTPLSNGSETLLYVCEQAGRSITAEISVVFGDGLHILRAELPASILRNRVYTLRVHGSGADATVSVATDEWEEGASVEAAPSLKGLVNVEASTLPDGVRVNRTCDSVYVSHRPGNFRLVLHAEADSQVDIEGSVRGVNASIEAQTRALQEVAAVNFSTELRFPGESRSYIYLDIHRSSLYSGRIVVVFEPNPVKLSGPIELDETGSYDFGRYVDGELGRLVVPEGMKAHMEFDDDEDPWILLDETDEEIRILGGWRPNDPKADGRTQYGRIVISDADGSNPESYVISRRNYGLPVVEIGGTWWCKYNLRGDARSFDDQVQIAADPATADGLADYLAGCSEEELLALLGDQYQGGNPQGLPLRHDGEAFYYEGMKTSGQSFGSIDPASMAPDGYMLPGYDDYAFFSGSNNYNIGGVGSRTYNNAAGESIEVRVIEREATLLGQSYGNISFYEFRHGDGTWVLYGTGHQWDTTRGNIARKSILLATCGSGSNSWLMEGYAQSVKPNQNWLKFTAHNPTKTRTVRCVKQPVEYIY